MTGYIASSNSAPLSVLTVLAMADLGYQVDSSKADYYNVSQDVIDTIQYGSLLGDVKEKQNLRGKAKRITDKESYGNDIMNMPLTLVASSPKRP